MRIVWTDWQLFACTYSPRHTDLTLVGVARTVTVLWWLTYKLPVEREVDDAAIAEAAAVARWDVMEIAGIRDAFSVH